MANVSDITTTPLSGLTYINALLDKGPDWNYQPAAVASNTLYYTFSVGSGTEEGISGQQAFSISQQQYTQQAFDYLHALTGINFVLTADGDAAQIHLCNRDIPGASTTGLCSWSTTYWHDGDTLTDYDAHAYVYLDNREWRGQNSNLAPGGYGYETLLHELGHALGLKHPFDIEAENTTTLPVSLDSTYYTLMSYDSAGGPYSEYRQFDRAALAWLYGGDGLGGKLGLGDGTTGRYIIGTDSAETLVAPASNDTLEGAGGNDTLDGGAGTDTAHFRGDFASYAINQANGTLTVSGGSDGTDTLRNIELLQFSDRTVSTSSLAAIQVNGSAANEHFTAVAGDTSYNGGDGLDQISYGAARGSFQVAHTSSGTFTVTDLAGNGGTDTLASVERAVFADRSAVAFDIAGNAGLAYRMYKAAFNRVPDSEGLGFWIDALDRGTNPENVADGFIHSNEFTAHWGANIGTHEFLTALYVNLRNGLPDAEGIAFWQHAIDVEHVTREHVMTEFAASAEMQVQVIGLVQDGIVYTPYA